MRLTSIILLATMTCLSLSSCTFFRGGDGTDLVEPDGVTGGVVVDHPSVENESVESEPEDDAPPEEEQTLQLTTLYSTASLNVRSGRGTSHSVVSGLSYGDAVAAGGLENDWYELFSEGKSIGFAHAGYLSTEKPAPRIRDAVPSASLETGLFGVSLPVGASLVESTPLTVETDAMESYRVPMANEEIHAFYERELSSLGWKPDPPHTSSAGTRVQPAIEAPSRTTLNYRKGNLVLAVILDGNGQRFTLTGGQR